MPAEPDFSFLTGGGEVSRIIREFNWAATPIGAAEHWPAPMKATISLILGTPVPIVTLWGEDGVMIYNDAYSGFAGGRHPELFGSKVREGWPEVADFNDNVMKVGLFGGTLAYQDQELTLFRNGAAEQVWMNLDYSPIRGSDGEPIGVMAVVVETTAKVRAEQDLRSERESLRRLFQQAPGFIAVVRGPRHEFVMANEAYRTLVGGREVVGCPVAEALPELASQGFIDLLDRVYTSGEPYVGRAVPVRLGGGPGPEEIRYLDFVYQPIVVDGSRISGIFVQGHDVTEQKTIEGVIRAETHKLAVLNRTGAAVAAELNIGSVVQTVTDACTELVGAQFGAFFYNVVDANGASYRLYALSGVDRETFDTFPMPRNTTVFAPTFSGTGIVRSDDIVGDPRYGKNAPHHGMPEGHLPVRSYLAVPVISRSGEVLGGLFFGHAKPGQFLEEHEDLVMGIAGQAATAMDNARLYQAAETEIQERRRAEEALQTLNNTLEQRVLEEVQARTQAEAQLRQSQKMEAVGQLTGGIAHDFNNMLAVIMGSLDLLQRRLEKGEHDVERFVKAALEGAQRAATLTQRLLAFSRQQPLEPRPLDANRLVAGMSELLGRSLGEQISIETVLAAGLWEVNVDPAQLENAILNLSVNARDAMPTGGKLTIETQNAHIDNAYGREYAVSAGQFVLLAVTDSGEGMPQEVMDRAFDPFFTTKAVGKGTGLGLSQVYGFVRQSGGHIKLYSEPGVGTTVKIYLPRFYGKAVKTEESSATAGLVRGTGSERVLVVEDDERVRALSIEALKELGYEVLEAATPGAAVAIIESGQVPTLLFTDVVMPEMSGRELADRIRELQPEIKVLFTTGYTRNAIVHNGMLDPGTSLLTKPFNLEDLANKLRSMLDE